jgi:hypothetical protein
VCVCVAAPLRRLEISEEIQALRQSFARQERIAAELLSPMLCLSAMEKALSMELDEAHSLEEIDLLGGQM